MEFRATIPLAPVPWARAASRRGVRFTPAKQRAYMAAVQNYLLGAMRDQKWEKGTKRAVELELLFVFERARSNKTAYHAQKPDASNLVKIVEDAANGVLWHDDCQIVRLTAQKVWGLPARTELIVRVL